MTTEKYYVLRHPEFHRRTDTELKRYDETDYKEIIAVTPYKYAEVPGGGDYRKRKPPQADERIKYDHSIVNSLFPERVPDVVLDILEIAVATFAADKAVERGIQIADDFDESRLNTRNIKLQIPVLSPEIADEEVEQLYSEMVSHITRDIIEYDFQLVEGNGPVKTYTETNDLDAVSLLSDGLDSTAGIYHNQRQGTDSKYVTANYGSGAGSKAEEIAEQAGVRSRTFRTRYKGRSEPTQFSRGLLHLSFGAAAAIANDAEEVRCFENGVMARFLILSEGWMTTRTVSPLFLTYFNKILEDTVSPSVEVKNPFVDLTKSEIIDKIPSTEIVQETVSCPHKARFGNQNCGLCVPCLIRNIGIITSSHELPLEDLSKYNPLVSADFENQVYDIEIKESLNQSANSSEIFLKGITEIAYFCRRLLEDSPRELATEYPELTDETIYRQHHRFAENFTEALDRISDENQTISTLLP
ncbi:7-cyano-7-deazaguanine synthase [Haloarchaeobius amylolyticus]|uniref:7-cyano-7-deazaguanine synthase n=1 Tax=Haloarchaeobius amylolyticus TaxID=1198296 RepID=A0ABD6BB26_9EURY